MAFLRPLWVLALIVFLSLSGCGQPAQTAHADPSDASTPDSTGAGEPQPDGNPASGGQPVESSLPAELLRAPSEEAPADPMPASTPESESTEGEQQEDLPIDLDAFFGTSTEETGDQPPASTESSGGAEPDESASQFGALMAGDTLKEKQPAETPPEKTTATLERETEPVPPEVPPAAVAETTPLPAELLFPQEKPESSPPAESKTPVREPLLPAPSQPSPFATEERAPSPEEPEPAAPEPAVAIEPPILPPLDPLPPLPGWSPERPPAMQAAEPMQTPDEEPTAELLPEPSEPAAPALPPGFEEPAAREATEPAMPAPAIDPTFELPSQPLTEPNRPQAPTLRHAKRPSLDITNTRHLAWVLGAKMSLLSEPSAEAEPWVPRGVAEMLGFELRRAEFGESTEDNVGLLLKTAAVAGEQLTQKFGEGHAALLEIAVKSNALAALYQQRPDLAAPVADAIEKAASRAELDDELCAPLLATLRGKPTAEQVRTAVFDFHRDAEEALRRP